MSLFTSSGKQIQQQALHMPEVLEAIFACSNRHHILNFSLVCRQWYRVTRRFSSTVLIWQDTMGLSEQMSRLNHLHRTHILDCTADIYGTFRTDLALSSTLVAENHRLAAWKFLRAKIVEQSRVVRHTTTTILSTLHGMGNKSQQPAPGSILLDSIPLQELIIRGNITLEDSIVPVFRELSTLRSLKLVKTNLVTVNLQLILESFPELSELDMEPVTVNHAPLLEPPRGFDEESAVNCIPQRFRLQRFRIQNFSFYQQVLEAYLRAMPELVDLRLIDLLRYDLNGRLYPQSPRRPYNRNQLLDTIATSCPNLHGFQLSFDDGERSRYYLSNDPESQKQYDVDMHELSTRLPSSIQHWGFSARDMRDTPILQLHYSCFDRLTTLEVTPQRHAWVHCDKFHRMLCTNESLATLRHLKILGFVYNVMYLKMDMPIVLDRTYGANHPLPTTPTGEVDTTVTAIASTPAVYPDPARETVQPYWQCRNLLTLHIHLSSDNTTPAPDLYTRRPLAYIAKLCPNLQELRVKKDTLVMTPMGGLCHLTELEDLERLALDVTHIAPVADKDLAWMRQTYIAPSKSVASGTWKMPWGLGRPVESTGSEACVASHDKTSRRRRGEHEPLTLKEAYAVGESHDVQRVLKKLEQRQDTCWPHLESFKVQIHWTHAANMQVEQLQRRLPHVLCRVGANVLDR